MNKPEDTGHHRASLSTPSSNNEAASLQDLREVLLRDQAEGLDTRSNNDIARFLNQEHMRNSQLTAQRNFNQDFSGGNIDIMNNYGSSLVQQYLQRQQRQHLMEQNFLAQRFEQLQQQQFPLSHDIRQFGTNPFGFVPSLRTNAFTPNVLPFQLPHNSMQQDNLLHIFMANTIDRPYLQPSNDLESSSLAVINSLEAPSIIDDSSLRHIQHVRRPSDIVANTSNIAAERHTAAIAPLVNNSTSNNFSDSTDRGEKEETPLRALSAYNFFFRYERERILNSKGDDGDCDLDVSEKNKEALLKSHWNRDRTVKRRHRKSHGKISFAKLSKTISQRWNELPEHEKKFFTEVATKDWERYHREMEQQKQKNAGLI